MKVLLFIAIGLYIFIRFIWLNQALGVHGVNKEERNFD